MADKALYDVQTATGAWVGLVALTEAQYAAVLSMQTSHGAWLTPAVGFGEYRPITLYATPDARLVVEDMRHLPYTGNLCRCQHPDGRSLCAGCAALYPV